jgi:hypothetical protein
LSQSGAGGRPAEAAEAASAAALATRSSRRGFIAGPPRSAGAARVRRGTPAIRHQGIVSAPPTNTVPAGAAARRRRLRERGLDPARNVGQPRVGSS